MGLPPIRVETLEQSAHHGLRGPASLASRTARLPPRRGGTSGGTFEFGGIDALGVSTPAFGTVLSSPQSSAREGPRLRVDSLVHGVPYRRCVRSAGQWAIVSTLARGSTKTVTPSCGLGLERNVREPPGMRIGRRDSGAPCKKTLGRPRTGASPCHLCRAEGTMVVSRSPGRRSPAPPVVHGRPAPW